MFPILLDLADLAFFFIGVLPTVGEQTAAHRAYVILAVCGFNTLDDKIATK
jgi:hypothetical protein